MVLIIATVLIGVVMLALLGGAAVWLWKKGPYGRVAAVALALFFGYTAFDAVFPSESFYREEFEHRTGLTLLASARIVFKQSSYPDFHGDYAAEMLFEVSPEDFAWLEKALALQARAPAGAIAGMFRRQAEAHYGRPLEPSAASSIRQRDTDEHGAWALLNDRKTVYFWFVQT